MRLSTRLRLWWHRLWIRKDEFHISLDYDWEAVKEMNQRERDEYQQDLIRRRDIAHRKLEKKK